MEKLWCDFFLFVSFPFGIKTRVFKGGRNFSSEIIVKLLFFKHFVPLLLFTSITSSILQHPMLHFYTLWNVTKPKVFWRFQGLQKWNNGCCRMLESNEINGSIDTKWIKTNPIKDISTLSRRRSLSYRNQSIDFLCKSMDWFLYHSKLRHERSKITGTLSRS